MMTRLGRKYKQYLSPPVQKKRKSLGGGNNIYIASKESSMQHLDTTDTTDTTATTATIATISVL